MSNLHGNCINEQQKIITSIVQDSVHATESMALHIYKTENYFAGLTGLFPVFDFEYIYGSLDKNKKCFLYESIESVSGDLQMSINEEYQEPGLSECPSPEAGFTQDMINVNVVRLWKRLAGDEAVARAMAEEYVSTSRKDCSLLSEALFRNNRKALSDTAHRLRGTAGIVGHDALTEKAAYLETNSLTSSVESLQRVVQSILTEVNRYSQQTETWLHE